MFELIFFTSNRTKMQHARYLCREYDINITNFREKTYHANYDEPRINDRIKLLKESLRSAKNKAKSAGLPPSQAFIIEDTSVIIDALSKDGVEYPGLDIKYWMRENSFEDIDIELAFSGNNRSVTVRSDLVLYIPTIREEEFIFTSCTSGTIVKLEDKSLQTNAIYPWLDNKTFNKWFCPSKEKIVISQMPIEVADKYDFRKNAFLDMLSFLEKKHIISKTKPPISPATNKEIINDISACHIVTGLSCAGKTTIAEYLTSKYSFFHIEASDFMHLIYLETHGEKSDVQIGIFAEYLLSEKPTLVAEKVLDFLEKYNWPYVVITGFRKYEEVVFIQDNYIAGRDAEIIFISSNSTNRKERKLQRNRSEVGPQRESFEERDSRELDMGLTKISLIPQINIIENDKGIDDYYHFYEHVMNLYAPMFAPNETSKLSSHDSLRLKDLIALALYKKRGPGERNSYYTTGEICTFINNELTLSKPKFRENIGRLLNKKFDVFFEVYPDKKLKIKKFRLSNTGTSHAKLLLKRYTI
ncbi:non-canonical purine NTP pyrophosphatase [Aeromonas salmonicida]|uniref:non-canonical purine NTP pyrophosphatase n=1 Tax=Aeromonas salmonicida TaxID=645 RepID=UPI003D2468FB